MNELEERIGAFIAEKIKTVRVNSCGGHGLPQRSFGRILGEKANTISRWETGEYKPSAVDLIKICFLLNIPASEFCPDYDPSPGKPRFLIPPILTEEDKAEVENFIRFKEWQRTPARKKSGRKKA
ncbi:helix-turn-helix domain-containing protein [Leptospira stimsonii]|uniref:helix-turn-helix domain-containing protein n=1 Tax=Leptospira stimsonii TaxID=2202203 RepID=UPI001083F49C|nr:helix-turn-helix domain-containing protein [Leptospira stimsonii]